MQRSLFVLAMFVAVGCNRHRGDIPRAEHGADGPADDSAPVASQRATTASSAVEQRRPTGGPSASPRQAGPGDRPFGELVNALSEPDGPFSSDNDVSNESSYLDVGPELARRAPGGAYIGVGPEQNFTYIALTRPRVAFIIDIRRRNMLLHLLYRALFQEAADRSHFLTLLLGRPYDASSAPRAEATLEEVLAHAERLARDRDVFDATHARLRAEIASWRVSLSLGDERALDAIHRAFFDAQLDIHFEMSPPSGRRYPNLRSLLLQTDPSGHRTSFLASEEAFTFVRDLERSGRVIPIVGDFAGSRALPGVAEEIQRRGLAVSAFYVSNVEQYLFTPGVWSAWVSNVRALPIDDASVFVRAYLDQGRKHPLQRAGQRTTTLVQRMSAFEARATGRGYRSFWELVTDGA